METLTEPVGSPRRQADGGPRAGGLRVLIVAEHASARFGGEAALPLHYFRLLRRRGVEAWMVVHARTRDELSALLPEEAGRIHYVPDTSAHRLLHALGRPLPARVHLFTLGLLMRLLTQRAARRVARRLVKERGIDVVHQPIPVSPKESSLLYGLGAPVVVGPMNGGMSYPPGLRRAEGRFVRLFNEAGRWASHLVNRLLPGKLRAATLVAANERTRRALPPGARGEVVELVENGVDFSLWEAAGAPQEAGGDRPVRFLFAGRLVDWKAVDLLLEAFREVVRRTPAVLDVYGEGPVRARLEAQAARLGLGGAATFRGWVSQADLCRALRSADVFVLPSLFECGGAVVLEAMAAGLPVVATRWGGPADYLDARCGVLVEPTSRGAFVAGLARAMTDLAAAPDLRRRMGRAGRERAAREFDWERKIDRMLEIYADAVRRGEPPPPGASAQPNRARRRRDTTAP
jgi:glycosyltransferase involved in cell wall biosynthesis